MNPVDSITTLFGMALVPLLLTILCVLGVIVVLILKLYRAFARPRRGLEDLLQEAIRHGEEKRAPLGSPLSTRSSGTVTDYLEIPGGGPSCPRCRRPLGATGAVCAACVP